MIIVYGGAFDPPHNGHVESLKEVLERHPSARAMIVPGLQPAGAKGNHKTPLASFADRVAMCEIAFETKRYSNRVVSTIETELDPPNYSLKTLQLIRAKYPDEKLFLMMGQDQIKAFPDWHKPRDILALASLIVVKRRGESTLGGDLLDETERTAFFLDLKLHWTKSGLTADVLNLEASIELFDLSLCEAESSVIRRCIAESRAIPSAWLSAEVNDYIHSHSLYRN